MNTTVHLLAHELADSWTGKYHHDGRMGLIDLLGMYSEPASQSGSGGGGKVTGSPAPWDANVEMLLGDIDAGARSLEIELCRVLRWETIERGGSRLNTLAALRRLPSLVDQLEHDNAQHRLVRGEWHEKRKRYRCGEVQKRLSTWHRQARVVLGVEQKHALLPQPCSVADCGEKALRQRPYGGVICGACGETYSDDELHDWFLPTQPKEIA